MEKLCRAGLHLKPPGPCAECHKLARARWSADHPEEHKRHRRDSARRHAIEANTIKRQKYLDNVEGERARVRRWAKAHPEKVVAANERRRAREIGAFGDGVSLGEWRAILKRQRHRCAHCGEKRKRLTKDHVVPLSEGGVDMAHNVQALCQSCNSKKKVLLFSGMQHSLFEGKVADQKPTLCGAGRHPKVGPGRCEPCSRDRRARWAEANRELHLASKRESERRRQKRLYGTGPVRS